MTLPRSPSPDFDPRDVHAKPCKHVSWERDCLDGRHFIPSCLPSLLFSDRLLLRLRFCSSPSKFKDDTRKLKCKVKINCASTNADMAQSSRTDSSKGRDTPRSKSSRAFDPGKDYRRIAPAGTLEPLTSPWDRISPFTAPAKPHDFAQPSKHCPSQSNFHLNSTFTSAAAYTLKAPPPPYALPTPHTFDQQPFILQGRQSPSSQVYTSLFPTPTGSYSPNELPPANRPNATPHPHSSVFNPLLTPATTPRLHTQPLAYDRDPNYGFSFLASSSAAVSHPQPILYRQSIVENTGKGFSRPPNFWPTPQSSPLLQLKVEDTSDEDFLSKVPPSVCVHHQPGTLEPATHLPPKLEDVFAEASSLTQIPVDFGPPSPSWKRRPFLPKTETKLAPYCTPKLNSYPEWNNQSKSETHELSLPDSSPLKSYPRAKHNPRATRSSKRLPETQPSGGPKKRKVTSSTKKLVSQANQSGTPTLEGAQPALVQVVKLQVETETVEASDLNGNLVALVRLPAFSGYQHTRYLRESAVGHKFSHFGKTRLLPTFRPGRVRQSKFTQIENMGPSVRLV